MARVRPKAETNFQYYRIKHLVHYMNLTPFIRNNTHDNIIIYIYISRGLKMNGEIFAVKHIHANTSPYIYQINRLT